MERIDGRSADQLRSIDIIKDYISYPEGSVLISMGNTKVLCNVTIEDTLPRWLKEQENPHGWVTGEYSMLPRSTHTRNSRETKGLKGRTQEIQRLIGRSLRAGINLEKLGERSCLVDCDVLQADGGTRTASITGGYVALCLALKPLIDSGELPADVIETQIGAISVGVADGTPILDLCYEEDSSAEVDANIVMTGKGEFVEIQGTGEDSTFSRAELDSMLGLAEKGISEIFEMQQALLS